MSRSCKDANSLCFAAFERYAPFVRAQIEHGADLSTAICQGYESVVRTLIKHGVDLNMRTFGSYGTPLISAAIHGGPMLEPIAGVGCRSKRCRWLRVYHPPLVAA